MLADEAILSGVRAWVEKAESDLKVALLAVKAGADGAQEDGAQIEPWMRCFGSLRVY